MNSIKLILWGANPKTTIKDRKHKKAFMLLVWFGFKLRSRLYLLTVGGNPTKQCSNQCRDSCSYYV